MQINACTLKYISRKVTITPLTSISVTGLNIETLSNISKCQFKKKMQRPAGN